MIQPKHFLIACGGTGGHLSPGIAVAQELTARGHTCKLLISEKRVDQMLCGTYPELTFIPLSGVGFSKKLSNLPRCLWAAFKNILQSFRLLRQTRADAVIGFGGFTNVGIILAAKFLRKPCFLHEANRIPGRAVRTLGRWATTVYVPELFQNQQHLRMKVCGFPIRREFRKIDKAVAKQRLSFNPQKPLLVTVGGSQGAQVLTQWAREHVEDFKKHNLQLLCLTGVRNNDEGVAGTTTAFVPAATISVKYGEWICQTTIATTSPSLNTSETGNGNAERKKTTASFTLSSVTPDTDVGSPGQKTQEGIACPQGQCTTDPSNSAPGFPDETHTTEAIAAVHTRAMSDVLPTADNNSNACRLDSKRNAEASEPSNLSLYTEKNGEVIGFPKSMQRAVAPEAQFASTAGNENKTSESETGYIANEGTLSDTAFFAEPSRTDRSEVPSVRFIPFCHQMHVVYSAADVVIGRAGAGTIAELTVCETPSILIPLPTSADGHQRANARAFEQRGGCLCLEQNDLPKLWEKVLEMLSDKKKRSEMSECLRELHHEDATQMMVTDIERTLCAK